jgi:hypothetical protein
LFYALCNTQILSSISSIKSTSRLQQLALCNTQILSSISSLQSTSRLQQLWELALLGLQVRVSTNVLVIDEDVWDGALSADLLESILDLGSIIDLVELDGVELGTRLGQGCLCGLAVWAVRLGENG